MRKTGDWSGGSLRALLPLRVYVTTKSRQLNLTKTFDICIP